MQPNAKAQGFMRGAMLITASALISRILGSVYRPVAQLFLHDRGLALVTPPNAAYQIIFAISSVGLNVAISRLISERLALGDMRGARRVFQVASILLTVSGTVFSLLFALGAPWMARAMGFPEAWPGFVALAPSLFLVAQLSVYRGLYQGMQQMTPSAVSQVIEQVARVVLGLAAVALLTRVALNYGAAAFNAGNTVGVLLGMVYSAWVYFREKPTSDWNSVAPGVQSVEHESTRRLLGKILSIALPLSLVGAILPVMQLIDSGIVTNRLLATGVAEPIAKEALSYLTNAATLRDLPSILTIALYISLVPAVTESYATGRIEQARMRASTALRLTFLVGIPATAGLLFGAKETYEVLFTGTGYSVMAPLAWSTIFLMIQQTASGALQGMGLIWLSVRNLMVGVVVKTILTYWWTTPALLGSGAAYATSVGVAVTAALNLWSVRQLIGLGIRPLDDLVKPTVASVLMGLGIWLSSPYIHHLVHSGRLAGLVTAAFGGLIYAVSILAVGGVKEGDLALLPVVGPRAAQVLRRFRLLRGG